MAEPIRIRFVSTVSTRGRKEYVVNIPKPQHDKAKLLKGKDIKVTIEEIPLD